MKKILFLFILFVAVTPIVFTACSKSKMENASAISHYTCPMHPQIHKDKPGKCPICGMDLVPVEKETKGEKEGGVMITPERQQLIGVKFSPVEKKEVQKEIRTTGIVAFDPELSVAQKEYVEVLKFAPSLKEASRSRLKLLGMNDEEISQLGKKDKISSNLFLPNAKNPAWVYATIYEYEAGLIKEGSEAVISVPEQDNFTLSGVVRSINPVLDASTRSLKARIELPEFHSFLKPNAFVNVTFKIDLGKQLTIPKSALINTGARKVAFVRHEEDHFQSKDIITGGEIGDDVIVSQGLEEGETVVAAATFLVDSESQLKAAVSGAGEHQH